MKKVKILIRIKTKRIKMMGLKISKENLKMLLKIVMLRKKRIIKQLERNRLKERFS